MGVVLVGCRFGLAVVFILAAVPKLARRDEFVLAVSRYDLLSPRAASVVGRVLPAAELSVGLLLALGLGTRLVAGLVALMLIGFGLAIALNLLRGRVFDCGCGTTVSPRRLSWLLVAEDLAYGAVAAAVAIAAPAALSLDSVVSGRAEGLTASAALAALVAGTLVAWLIPFVHDARALDRALPR